MLNYYDDGRLARGCGLVTVRQRPGTANGVFFLTLEDETGNVNVIVWPSLVKRQRKELMSAKLLGVYGQWQNKNNVRHLVAMRVVDVSHLLGELDTRSEVFTANRTKYIRGTNEVPSLLAVVRPRTAEAFNIWPDGGRIVCYRTRQRINAGSVALANVEGPIR